jgi:hypothetical protein
MDCFDQYTFITNMLMKFTLECETNGVDGEEEEAIIIDDDSLITGFIEEKSLLTPSEPSQVVTESPEIARRGNPPTSFRSFKTYELSEEGGSQKALKDYPKEPVDASMLKRRKNTQALVVNIDEEEEDSEDEPSIKAQSPISRFGWQKQHSAPEPDHELLKSKNRNKQMTKLSRKPDKNISKEEEKEEITDTIEVSDLESSLNSLKTSYVESKDDSIINNAQSLDIKSRPPTKPISLSNINHSQKDELLNHVTQQWVSQEINKCMNFHEIKND